MKMMIVLCVLNTTKNKQNLYYQNHIFIFRIVYGMTISKIIKQKQQTHRVQQILSYFNLLRIDKKQPTYSLAVELNLIN